MLRIKELCKLNGITATELGNRIGMMQPSLSRIINGGNTTTSTLETIASALGVSVAELFENPKSNTFHCPNCNHELKVS